MDESTEIIEQEIAAEQQGEPAPSPDPAPDPAPDPDARAEPDKDPGERTVPHGAFHEERMRRKDLEKKIESMEQSFHDYRTRQEEQLKQLTTPAKYEDDMDPVEQIRSENMSLKERIEKHEQYLQGNYEREQQNQQVAALQNRYIESANAYRQDNANFDDAYNFVVQSSMKQFKAAGLNDKQAIERFQNQELSTALSAYKSDPPVNPAERIYNIAVAMGYSPKAGQEQLGDAQKIANLEKVMNQTGSINSVQNNAESGELTLEKYASMSDEDKDKNWESLVEKYS